MGEILYYRIEPRRMNLVIKISHLFRQFQRFALPALGRAAERRPTGKMLKRRKRLGIAPESPASGAPRKSGAHFSRQKPFIGFAKYTPKRQDNKPYKAVEECRRGIPEVHRGYRSN